MTSLIDVIFLLLLFFMLSSTFTRFAEVELASAGAGTGDAPERPVFLSLAPETLRLNGNPTSFEDLPEALAARKEGNSDITVLIALQAEVSAQRLTDLLVALRALPGLRITVLEAT